MAFWNLDKAITKIKSKISGDKVTWELNNCFFSLGKKLRFGERGREECKVLADFTAVDPLKLFIYWFFHAQLAELFTVPT